MSGLEPSGTAQSERLAGSVTKVQSDFLLPTARILHVVTACAALLTVIVGLLVAGFYATQTMKQAKVEPLPEAYSPSAISVDLNSAARKLKPPTRARFVVEQSVI